MISFILILKLFSIYYCDFFFESFVTWFSVFIDLENSPKFVIAFPNLIPL